MQPGGTQQQNGGTPSGIEGKRERERRREGKEGGRKGGRERGGVIKGDRMKVDGREVKTDGSEEWKEKQETEQDTRKG